MGHLLADDLIEILLFAMLGDQLTLELLRVLGDSASVQGHIVGVNSSLPLELLLESLLRAI